MIVAINKIFAKPERNFSKACDLAMPVRFSNPLSYEATDSGRWSFVESNRSPSGGASISINFLS